MFLRELGRMEKADVASEFTWSAFPPFIYSFLSTTCPSIHPSEFNTPTWDWECSSVVEHLLACMLGTGREEKGEWKKEGKGRGKGRGREWGRGKRKRREKRRGKEEGKEKEGKGEGKGKAKEKESKGKQ
jgi:hypothetical protein